MNVEAFGGTTTLPWRMCGPSIAEYLLQSGYVDQAGYEAVLSGALGVHPTFFYESMWNLAGLFLVYQLGKRWRKYDGECFLFYLCWYGLGRAWIEGLRTDSLYFFGLELFGMPIRVSQMVAAVCFLAAGALLLYQRFRPPRPGTAVCEPPQDTSGHSGNRETRDKEGGVTMAATIMDGKALAAKVKEEVREQTSKMEHKPGLAVVLVGDDPASRVYVNGKRRDCEACGIYSEEYALPAETSQQELLELVETLNGREDIDGILVQLPLPRHLDEKAVLLAIRPDKDVDCFHPFNVGQLMIGEAGFQPCTPGGHHADAERVRDRSRGKALRHRGPPNIVGKPQAMLMLRENATVTVCHTRTRDLKAECLKADILVAAAGRAGLISGDMVKEGAVVVDVAMNRSESGKLCGDVVYNEAAERASYITPVPGGVGPMTRAMLMENTLRAAWQHGKR